MDETVRHIVQQASVTAGLHYRNPSVPYACPLPGSLTVGSQILIQGLVPAVSLRFSVNLQRGAGEGGDIFLHFNPRFEPSGPVVVRNSLQGKSWGREEREGPSPFAQGRPFVLVITALPQGYELAVNGLPFTTFAYREGLALADITHLTVHGDVLLRSLHILVPEMPKCLRVALPDKAKVGDVFALRGEISPWPEKLILNLTSGMGKDDDVALHVNPRFAESAIVRNSLKGGSWGEEERDGEMPLAIGQPFRLSVAVLEDCFRLTINDAHFADYAHRLSVGSVRNLVVEGDAVIHDVVVESQENELELGQADNWELYQPPEMPQEEALQEDQQVTELLAESQIHFEPKLEVIQPPKPVCQRIPEVMTPGRVVIVSGEVEPAAQRFYVNLQTDVGDTADVGLHINPRFDTNPRGVVLNSRDRDQWQSEVQVTEKFPFAPGSPFELQIHCQEDKFRLIVNGCFLANFPHRIDLSRIDYICVDGSLIVDRVVFA